MIAHIDCHIVDEVLLQLQLQLPLVQHSLPAHNNRAALDSKWNGVESTSVLVSDGISVIDEKMMTEFHPIAALQSYNSARTAMPSPSSSSSFGMVDANFRS